MRSKNEGLMERIIDEVDLFYNKYERTPSTRELAQKVGLSHNTVARYLREMSDRRMLEYNDGVIVTERMSKYKTASKLVPVLGSVSCGAPLLSEANIDSYVRLPDDLIGGGEYYFLRANGDSMIEAGISDGDLVLVRKTVDARDGEIVVALVDNENTLKRLYHDEKRHKIVLHPENYKYSDIIVDGCEIQGVAVKILKDIR